MFFMIKNWWAKRQARLLTQAYEEGPREWYIKGEGDQK
jgi:hypothetical protein